VLSLISLSTFMCRPHQTAAPARRAARNILLAAAAYNLAWGTAVIAAPLATLQWCGFPEPPRYPQLWQCLGMIVGVYGVGYGIAASNPARHWPMVLVGLLGKVLGPIGMAQAVWGGTLPLSATRTIVTNDLIWWLPFGWVLYMAWRSNVADAADRKGADERAAHQGVVSH
jgi:hypothetical protein